MNTAAQTTPGCKSYECRGKGGGGERGLYIQHGRPIDVLPLHVVADSCSLKKDIGRGTGSTIIPHNKALNLLCILV